MGESLSKLFVPLESLPGLYDLPNACVPPEFDADGHLAPTLGGVVQLLFLASAYGLVLFQGSNLIADGSELLLLIPEIAPVVGSVVLPIFGAVPDGAVVLFSGLGEKSKAQEQLAVGVGALAGSTIMLLTIPYFLSVLAGRVDVLEDASVPEGRRCNYAFKSQRGQFSSENWRKLSVKGWRATLEHTGVEPDSAAMRSGARTMLVTAVSYLIIQGAAFAYHSDKTDEQVAADEKSFALAGLVICTVFFFAYLWQQISNSDSDPVLADYIDRKRDAAIQSGLLSLQGAFFDMINSELEATDRGAGVDTHLLGSSNLSAEEHKRARFEATVRKFYSNYDVDNSNSIDKSELKLLLTDLHIQHTEQSLDHFMREMDTDGDGEIHFHEFLDCMLRLISGQILIKPRSNSLGSYGSRGSHRHATGVVPTISTIENAHIDELMDHHENNREQVTSRLRERQSELEEVINDDAEIQNGGGHVEADMAEEEEEEEDVPEDLADLPPDQQRRRILMRAAYMMSLGTFLVLLFSDPMVDVMGQIGKVCGISPFYISFILAPLASNASELIASYQYATKKTTKTITISLTALEGAAIMNNTFCLGIFLALVYFRGLAWEFSAETISILAVELCVAVVAIRRIQTVKMATVVLMLFPLSLLLVYVLENVFGLD